MLYHLVFLELHRNHHVTPSQTIIELTRVKAVRGQRSVTLRAIPIWDPKLAESHTSMRLTRVGGDVGWSIKVQDAKVQQTQARNLSAERNVAPCQ